MSFFFKAYVRFRGENRSHAINDTNLPSLVEQVQKLTLEIAKPVDQLRITKFFSWTGEERNAQELATIVG